MRKSVGNPHALSVTYFEDAAPPFGGRHKIYFRPQR